MSFENAIIIRNKTRLEQQIVRFNTKAQAKFYVTKAGGKFEDFETENDVFYDSLDTIERRISKYIKFKIIDRSFLPSFIFSEQNLIIVIGQDGLVANTAKYVKGQPIIAINPDPQRYDGKLLPYDHSNFITALENVLNNSYKYKMITMAQAKLNDGQRLLAFNDLFIGVSSHISARYRISFNNNQEDHSSSGIIVSTGAGTTGWFSSLFNMANGLINNFSPNRVQLQKSLDWEDEKLLFAVREPFLSKKSQINISSGIIDRNLTLNVESYMPSNGVIFSDGIENDFINFNSGAIAEIGIAPEKAKLVV